MNSKGTSFDVLQSILGSISEIDSLNFKVFKENAILQDRLTLTNELNSVVSQALKLREDYRLPFWDAVNLSLFDKKFTAYDFIPQIGFHNHPEETFRVSKSQVDKFWKNWDKEKYLTVNSSVVLSKDSSAHLMLLDFHVPVNNDNEILCIEIIDYLGLSGWLLDSGKSYHFIGDKLYSSEMLFATLAKALLFSPIIDRAWIAHQLQEKSCCLRISNKYNRQPQVIQHLPAR